LNARDNNVGRPKIDYQQHWHDSAKELISAYNTDTVDASNWTTMAGEYEEKIKALFSAIPIAYVQTVTIPSDDPAGVTVEGSTALPRLLHALLENEKALNKKLSTANIAAAHGQYAIWVSQDDSDSDGFTSAKNLLSYIDAIRKDYIGLGLSAGKSKLDIMKLLPEKSKSLDTDNPSELLNLLLERVAYIHAARQQLLLTVSTTPDIELGSLWTKLNDMSLELLEEIQTLSKHCFAYEVQRAELEGAPAANTEKTVPTAAALPPTEKTGDKAEVGGASESKESAPGGVKSPADLKIKAARRRLENEAYKAHLGFIFEQMDPAKCYNTAFAIFINSASTACEMAINQMQAAAQGAGYTPSQLEDQTRQYEQCEKAIKAILSNKDLSAEDIMGNLHQLQEEGREIAKAVGEKNAVEADEKFAAAVRVETAGIQEKLVDAHQEISALKAKLAAATADTGAAIVSTGEQIERTPSRSEGDRSDAASLASMIAASRRRSLSGTHSKGSSSDEHMEAEAHQSPSLTAKT
jgi:hypothetical protein